MAKTSTNKAKIMVTKAVPGGTKADESFTKRSFANQKMGAGRKGNRADSGPRTSANAVKVSDWATQTVSDDNAGTRSRADLPPETTAMAAPAADLPAEAADLAAPALAVPTTDTPLYTVEPWDHRRDVKMGTQGSR